MAKIIFNNKTNIKLDNNKKKENFSTGFIANKDLFKNRSKKYLDLISKLDTQSLSETKDFETLIENIKEEYGIADVNSLPIGIVSKCFLGDPYEVHTLDLSGSFIIKHYKKGEKMEAMFEKVRSLAIHHEYAIIEIYKDKVLLVKENGKIVKL